MGILDAVRPDLSSYINNAVLKPIGVDGFYRSANGASVLQAMGRKYYVTKGAVSKLLVAFAPFVNLGSSGGESNSASATIISCSLEYLTGHNPIQFTFNGGKKYVVRQPTTANVNNIPQWLFSDALGMIMPEATPFYIRTYMRVSMPPVPATSTVVAGGSLTVTTYYYFITSVDIIEEIESGPSAVITLTTTIGNQTTNLAWASNVYAKWYNIYRSTTNDPTTAGLIGRANNPVSMLSFVDNGITPNAAIAPPETPVLYLTSHMHNALDSTFLSSADTTTARGVLPQVGSTITGNQGFMVKPSLLFANDATTAFVEGEGDSIQFGTGIDPNLYGLESQEMSNWFAAGLRQAGIHNYANFSIPSSTIAQFSDPTATINNTNRLNFIHFADYLVTDLGTNDAGASTWQQIVLNHIKKAKPLARMGKRYVMTTLCPFTTSTDNFITTTNQTENPNSAKRRSVSDWLRNGKWLNSSGFPIQASEAGATKCRWVYDFFRLGENVEVNAANVLTVNGTLWRVPLAPTYTGQVASGTPTLLSIAVTGTPYTASAPTIRGLISFAIKMTSGAAAGQTAVIASNTNNTLTLYANGSTALTGAALLGLTTIPAAGDTFDIIEPYTNDGVHPTKRANIDMAASFATYALAKMKPYGTMRVK